MKIDPVTNTPLLRRKRFDVEKLVPNEAFQVDVVERAQSEWPQGGSAEDEWSAMRSALTEAGETILGTQRWYHPDWFRESAAAIEPILKQQNYLYVKWLATKRPTDLQRFRQARGEARRSPRSKKCVVSSESRR